MRDIHPFPDFGTASVEILNFLYQRLNFDLWMITRTEGNDWIVLQVSDRSYGIEEGTVFSWADSFCCQMVSGQGPRIAPSASAIPAYAATPIAQQIPIGAYIGIPLVLEDGSLFGTLCAIDPNPQPEAITAELPLLELFARLLCSILENDLKLSEQTRRAERAEAEALTDPLTGLYNRRGWDQLLSAEESRCRRYGHPASVISVDLDDLKQVNDAGGHASGDELLLKAAQTIRTALRQQDIVARVGGDEFSILAVEADGQGASALLIRMRTQLSAAGIRASLGYATRHPAFGLRHAWQEADRAMYICKRANKGTLQV
jgi:diguanylate cyclase (GGDEF)-like protein